jgi:hypothetical protein
MAGNSWDLVESGGRRWLSGSTVEMIPSEERDSWSIADTTVSSGWETADLTSIIGTDVLIVMGYLQIGAAADADDTMLLNVKAIGDTNDHGEETRVVLFQNDTASRDAYFGWPTMFDCKGTDPGKIQYRQYGVTHQIDTMYFVVWGRIRP